MLSANQNAEIVGCILLLKIFHFIAMKTKSATTQLMKGFFEYILMALFEISFCGHANLLLKGSVCLITEENYKRSRFSIHANGGTLCVLLKRAVILAN